MASSRDCPELECWPALLAATLPVDQRERCEHHLESCDVCQARLDQAAEGRDPLLALARRLGDPTVTPPDPTLTEVLDRLHQEPTTERSSTAEPVDLFFLRAVDRPGLLGMLDAYEVQSVIGQGGMGVVLKAFEPALHRLVAIKVLAPALAGSPTARRRFTREAQAAAAVCHDHIVAVHGVHEIDGLPYLVMQYIAGESLQERLERTGPLDVADVVRIGLQTASGLAAAHAQGLIHRDIKPANLLLENGLARVKITDFGLARMADDVGLTQNGVVAGTPEYMAPEQARGEPVDHRADLFSLGSVLYALCTGVPPFRGSTALGVLRQVSEQEPRPVRSLNPDVPAWLEEFIARLLAKEPANRFQSAAEVASLLEGYLRHLRQPTTQPAPVLAPPSDAATSGTSARTQRRSRGLLVGFVLAVLGLVLWAQVPPERSSPLDLYQDFRKGQFPQPPLKLFAQDAAEVRSEEAGIRITVPGNRPKPDQPVGILAEVPLKGDFEITATYQLRSAEQPVKGPGAGVSLNITPNWSSSKWGHLARVRRTDVDNVFVARKETSGGLQMEPTAATSGQLRLARHGSTLHYLVTEGPGSDFRPIAQEQFGKEDVEVIRFMVNTNGSPTALDVSLVDLRIRVGKPTPITAAAPASVGRRTGSRGWIGAATLIGFMLLLAFGAWLYMRQGRRTRKLAAAASSFLSLQCTSCGRSLKTRRSLAGKKVKCPQCSHAVEVPAAPP